MDELIQKIGVEWFVCFWDGVEFDVCFVICYIFLRLDNQFLCVCMRDRACVCVERDVSAVFQLCVIGCGKGDVCDLCHGYYYRYMSVWLISGNLVICKERYFVPYC